MHGTIPVRSTYKTPAELGFTQMEFDALAWFVDEYDAGRIPDADTDKMNVVCWTLPYPADPPQAFYMPYIAIKHDCGTSGCIFGWVGHRVSHVSIRQWPEPVRLPMREGGPDIKAAHARDATVRVLRGEPAWA